MQILTDEIKRLARASDHEIQEIFETLSLKKLGKSQFLQKEGQVCRNYYFVDKGALRIYHEKGRKDFTVWIATEGQIFTDLDSYLYEKPSVIYIQAIEESRVFTISKLVSDQLARKLPAYNTLLRRTVEEAFASMSRNVISFQSEEATERYERLEEEKNWLLRFPLKYISSFLGITPSSLSRLRARR